MPLRDLVHPEWPPLRHVRAGWDALDAAERATVTRRVEGLVRDHAWPTNVDRAALSRFFAFLAQVETIAIEIPLRFLPRTEGEQAALLQAQLVDEVFHSTLFARFAHDLADGAPPPLMPEAEALLAELRAQDDLATSATCLNLVAEGWIETLFRHAATWGVADRAFAAVLADESRHVHEALEHAAAGLDSDAARQAVWRLEAGLLRVQQDAATSLAMLHLAGPERYDRLVKDLWQGHREHLAAIGVEPSAQWQEAEETMRETQAAAAATGPGAPKDAAVARPTRVPDTPWRIAARRVWDTPRDPTMQGGFDIPVGHIPKRLLTPVLVAAIGRAWHQQPALNRVLHGDGVWALPAANVGVRVLVRDGELATVVIADAHRRSVRDISYMIRDGVAQLQALAARRPADAGAAPAFDPALGRWLPPDAAQFSVALSNPGKFGLVTGAGAFSGHLAPSTDISVGQRRRLPRWRAVAYLPSWHVHLGCLQDHRVFDGREAGLAMTALRSQLSRAGVKAILRAPDTLDVPEATPVYDDTWFAALPPSLRALPQVGLAKYIPVVLGGAAVGAALGLGGYYLAKQLGDEGNQQQQQVVVVVEDDDQTGTQGTDGTDGMVDSGGAGAGDDRTEPNGPGEGAGQP